MPTEPPSTLPAEIVEQIFQEAWRTTFNTTPEERQRLYEVLSTAAPPLRGLIIHVAIRLVIIDWSNESLGDLNLYRIIADDAAAFQHITAATDPAVRAAFFDSLFQNSHVRLQGFDPLQLDDFSAVEWNAVPPTHPVTTALAELIRGCRSFTLAPPPVRAPLDARNVRLLLETFHHTPGFRALEVLSLDCTIDTCRFPCYAADPAPLSLPSVRLLRLKRLPLCSCALALRCACTVPALRTTFPRLAHLHLRAPAFLKRLCGALPRSCATLTLDAPPAARIPGRGAYSSLMDYNLGAALRRGLAETVRAVVVRSGPEEPFGWAAAREACIEFGVDLTHVVAYPEPVELCDLVESLPYNGVSAVRHWLKLGVFTDCSDQEDNSKNASSPRRRNWRHIEDNGTALPSSPVEALPDPPPYFATRPDAPSRSDVAERRRSF